MNCCSGWLNRCSSSGDGGGDGGPDSCPRWSHLEPAALLLTKSASPSALPAAGEASSSGAKRNWLLVRHYWHRVGGCALNWFVW